MVKQPLTGLGRTPKCHTVSSLNSLSAVLPSQAHSAKALKLKSEMCYSHKQISNSGTTHLLGTRYLTSSGLELERFKKKSSSARKQNKMQCMQQVAVSQILNLSIPLQDCTIMSLKWTSNNANDNNQYLCQPSISKTDGSEPIALSVMWKVLP